ncbi:hypothetical protein BTUL_0071g00420 [Botrytis tulipae]|uniref:Uncharacterized protein n=1 Tax=Botrytis tulipae TaxID=87230 RepID=A0A4Z1ELP2_9HELO|nr:hypothetical protein BTUL_0071g00420 [Botrytis tulipae]
MEEPLPPVLFVTPIREMDIIGINRLLDGPKVYIEAGSGSNSKVFETFRNLIRHFSPYAQRVLSGVMMSPRVPTTTISLHLQKVDTVKTFLYVMQTGIFIPQWEPTDKIVTPAENVHLALEVAVLADYMQFIGDGMDFAISSYVRNIIEFGDRSITTLPISLVEGVFDCQVTDFSLTRELIAKVLAVDYTKSQLIKTSVSRGIALQPSIPFQYQELLEVNEEFSQQILAMSNEILLRQSQSHIGDGKIWSKDLLTNRRILMFKP